MKYLLTDGGNYYDKDGNKLTFTGSFRDNLNLYGFELSSITDYSKVVNKKFITAKTSNTPLITNIKLLKNKYAFLFVNVDLSKYKNLYIKESLKKLISNDNKTWYTYISENTNTKIEKEVNIKSINDFKELSSYINDISKEMSYHSIIDNTKYLILKLNDNSQINALYTKVFVNSNFDIRIYPDITVNKNKIYIKSTKLIKINKMTVKIMRNSDNIINTLKEF